MAAMMELFKNPLEDDEVSVNLTRLACHVEAIGYEVRSVVDPACPIAVIQLKCWDWLQFPQAFGPILFPNEAYEKENCSEEILTWATSTNRFHAKNSVPSC